MRRLVIRRHRHSPEVASVVGADWAERLEPQQLARPGVAGRGRGRRASSTTVGCTPSRRVALLRRRTSALFPWTLAKAFLSSPAALRETVRQRIGALGKHRAPAQEREVEALQRLDELAAGRRHRSVGASTPARRATCERSASARAAPTRAVVFAERVATLNGCRSTCRRDLGLDRRSGRDPARRPAPTTSSRSIVDEFKQESSPIRVLVTGDVASEGVNLHAQCHELIHFDIPWSLIRIEQRNGRIDRYGQQHPPQITTLLLEPDERARSPATCGSCSRLIEKEHEAHTALGDVASLMGKYDVEAEEEAIREVLAGEATSTTSCGRPRRSRPSDSIAGAARAAACAGADAPRRRPDAGDRGRQRRRCTRRGRLPATRPSTRRSTTPGAGVRAQAASRWRELRATQQIVEFVPPPDLRQRLEVLPADATWPSGR